MVKSFYNTQALIHSYFGGDEHIIAPSKSGMFVMELSDNNTVINENTLSSFKKALSRSEDVDYVRIYSKDGAFYLEIASNDM